MAQVKFFRGLYNNYKGTTDHKDAIYFATDTHQILLTDKAGNVANYGTDAALEAKLQTALISAVFTTPDTITFTTADGNSIEAKIPAASAANAGLMSKENFEKLAGIAEGAQVNVIENVVVSGLSGTIANKTLTINGLAKSEDVYTKTAAESMVDTKVAAAVASVYKFKGSVASYSALPTNAAHGDVYNVESEYELHPAGTNWAWNNDTKKWDALGGPVDFSAVNGKIDGVQGEVDAVEGRMDTAEGNISSLRTDLGNKTDNADVNGSAFARIANLKAVVADLTGGSTESVGSQISNAINAAKAELKGDAGDNYNTLGKLEDAIIAEKGRAEQAESANTTAINNEKSRAEQAEAGLQGQIESNDADILDLQGRMTTAEGSIASHGVSINTITGEGEGSIKKAVADEKSRAEQAEGALAGRIASLESAVGSEGSVQDAIEAAVKVEEDRAKGVESGLRTDVDNIKNDYLKASDKQELNAAINGKVSSATYATDKEALEAAIAGKVDQSAYNTKMQALEKADSDNLDAAKAYADGLAKNYDKTGAAAAVQGNLDTEIARAKAAEEANAAAITALTNGQVKTNTDAIAENLAKINKMDQDWKAGDAALLGVSGDAASANTIHGAKAYAAAQIASALEWGEA